MNQIFDRIHGGRVKPNHKLFYGTVPSMQQLFYRTVFSTKLFLTGLSHQIAFTIILFIPVLAEISYLGNKISKEAEKMTAKLHRNPNANDDYFLGISSKEFEKVVKEWSGKVGGFVAK